MKLSKELEIYAEKLHIDDVKPHIQVLLARLAINSFERGINTKKEQIEKAKRFLEMAEQSATGDLRDHIDTLKVIIKEFEGSDSILNLLKDKTNPYAIRARLASLAKNKKYAEAVKLIEDQKKVHEYWAESALAVFLFKREDKKAKQILKTIEPSSNHSLFIVCSVKYAEILTLRLAQFEQEKAELDCKLVSEKILEVLAPVLQESSRPNSIKGIYDIANEIALKANLILRNTEEIKKYSDLLMSHTPIPLIVVECIMRQFILPPKNILKRIRDDHKKNINAHLLAAAIQTQCFREPQKSFLAIKKVLFLAKTKKEKEATLNCLLELWQLLDAKLADDCYKLAMDLSKTDSLSEIKFMAGKSLRENLALKEEKQLLEPFLKTAERSGILIVSRIKKAYENKLGRSVPESTVYRMLERHGWRKITPRPCHPKMDEEKQREFKKTSEI